MATARERPGEERFQAASATVLRGPPLPRHFPWRSPPRPRLWRRHHELRRAAGAPGGGGGGRSRLGCPSALGCRQQEQRWPPMPQPEQRRLRPSAEPCADRLRLGLLGRHGGLRYHKGRRARASLLPGGSSYWPAAETPEESAPFRSARRRRGTREGFPRFASPQALLGTHGPDWLRARSHLSPAAGPPSSGVPTSGVER